MMVFLQLIFNFYKKKLKIFYVCMMDVFNFFFNFKKKIKNILFGYDDFLKLILNLNKIKIKNIQCMYD